MSSARLLESAKTLSAAIVGRMGLNPVRKKRLTECRRGLPQHSLQDRESLPSQRQSAYYRSSPLAAQGLRVRRPATGGQRSLGTLTLGSPLRSPRGGSWGLGVSSGVSFRSEEIPKPHATPPEETPEEPRAERPQRPLGDPSRDRSPEGPEDPL